MSWLSTILSIPELIKGIKEILNNKQGKATKNLVLKELKLNLEAFEISKQKIIVDYDKLLAIIDNKRIGQALENGFDFNKIKRGKIEKKHLAEDQRNQKYAGKDCEWLFKNIDEKISRLQKEKEYHGSLNGLEKTNIPLRFSNLFYLLKLVAQFVINKK